MKIRDCFGESFPMFGELDRTRDALAAYVTNRWPTGRRKSVAKEWDLNDDEARSVCSGRCSWATFDKIISHKRGRWSVLLPVFGALLDETVEHHIITTRKEHAEHALRLGALVGDFGPWGHDRSFGSPDGDQSLADRKRPRDRRMG